jgi:peptidoglycan/LPS O-acetylase OafA/YrhL
MPIETPPAARSSARIAELDGIRGGAIGMVLLYHYLVLPSVYGSAAIRSAVAPLRLGWTGVDLFFVLSGFLIGGILLDARESRNYFGVFYRRRFLRIVPAYAMLLLVFYALLALNRSLATPRRWITPTTVPWYGYASFLHNFWMAIDDTWGTAVLGITWSLAVEEQFYLTLPWLVRLLDAPRLRRAVVTGLVAAPVLRTILFVAAPGMPRAWYLLMPCRADALLLGVLAAMAMRDAAWRRWLARRRTALRAVLVVLGAGVPVLTGLSAVPSGVWTATIGLTWIAAFYVTMLVYVLLFDGRLARCLRARWLMALGTVAYATYLFHMLVLDATFGVVWGRAPILLGIADVGKAGVALALTIAFCRLSWRWLERPLIALGHRTSYEAREPRTARPALGVTSGAPAGTRA